MMTTTGQPVPAGSILYRDDGWLTHLGIYLGGDSVYENAKLTGPRLTTSAAFTRGRPVRYRPLPTPMPVLRARIDAALASGQPYNVLLNNCEQSATWVAEGEARSPQLRFWVGAGFVLTFLVLAARNNDNEA